MSGKLIDRINQVDQQTGFSENVLGSPLNITLDPITNLQTIGTGVARLFDASSAKTDEKDAANSLYEKSMSVLQSRGDTERLAEADKLWRSKGGAASRSVAAQAISDLASQSLSSLSLSPGQTESTPTSANQKVKAGAGAGRKYNYDGPCPTMTTGGADRLARDGSRCGRRAASVRPGGWWV